MLSVAWRCHPQPANLTAPRLRSVKPELVSNMNRREKIEAMLAEDPSDTFLRYSLAMEMRSEGDHDGSLQRLQELMRDAPPYVPAYFMAAQQLVDIDRVDEARTCLREGIEQARQQQDSHAAAEMSDYLTSLGELGEL